MSRGFNVVGVIGENELAIVTRAVLDRGHDNNNHGDICESDWEGFPVVKIIIVGDCLYFVHGYLSWVFWWLPVCKFILVRSLLEKIGAKHSRLMIRIKYFKINIIEKMQFVSNWLFWPWYMKDTFAEVGLFYICNSEFTIIILIEWVFIRCEGKSDKIECWMISIKMSFYRVIDCTVDKSHSKSHNIL